MAPGEMETILQDCLLEPLFVLANDWNHPKCPSVENQLDRIDCVHTEILGSRQKEEKKVRGE